MPTNLKMLTMDEVADLMNTTRETLTMLRDIGIIRPIKIGKSYMFSQKEVARFQDEYIGCDLSNKLCAINAYKEKADLAESTNN